MGFGSDVASAGQPTRHIFVLVLTVKTVRLGRSKSLGHVESSASRQLIRALQTDRKVNSYASRVTYLYRDLPWEKSKIIILSKKTNKIRSLLPKSSKNLRKKIWDTTDSTNEHSISIQLHPAPTKIVASPAVAGTLTVTVFVLKPGEMAPSLALQDGCWGVDGEMDEK